MSKRVESIDVAKALCIILVVIGHYYPDNSPVWWSAINHFIYSFHMPLFMFASGYVYMATLKKEKYGHFIEKKVKRLMLPYLSTSVIVISLKLLVQHNMILDNPVTPFTYVEMLYLPVAGYYLWFVWALFLMFLVVPLFKTIALRTGLFIGALSVYFISIALPKMFCIAEFKAMLVFFMLGVFLCEHKSLITFAKRIPSIVGCLIFPCAYILINIFYPDGHLTILNFLLSILGIYAVCSLSRIISSYQNRLKESLLVVASSSYIIYLFHTTFMGFVKSALHNVPTLIDPHSMMFAIGALIVIIVGTLFPILLHRYVLGKNKGLRFLFGLK